MSSVAVRLFPIPVGGTQKLLRYPILLIVFLIVVVELIIYFILRLGVKTYEYLRQCWMGDKRQLWQQLWDATSYKEYVRIATEMDKIEKRNDWKSNDNSYCYDVTLVSDILEQMQHYIKHNNYEKLSSLLIEVFSHCLSWFETEELYTRTYHGTKDIVVMFIDTVVQSMKCIAECDESLFSTQSKVQLFTRLQHEFGRTALCLSGGGTLTFYQFGAVKALLETDLMPTILSGTSGGAMVGSFIAVRTDEELKEMLKPEMHEILVANNEPFLLKFRRFLTTGYYFDWNDWRDKTRVATKGDTTFLEAYQRTGRIFNVTACSDNHRPVLLNYKTAPHIVIWSAVIASAALPMLMRPSPLIKKTKSGELVEFTSYGRLMCDGSIQCDIPTQRLLEDFNVKFNVTVQCNPHVNFFYYNTRGTASMPVNHWGHSGMRGGFLSSLLEKLLKLEMRKWMRLLSDMDLLPQLFGHDWRHTAIQQTRGKLTMNPTPPLSYYFKLIHDPTLERMTEYLKGGQSMAYPYIGMLSIRLRLQRAMRKHIMDLDPTQDHSLLHKLLDGTSDDRYQMMIEKINGHRFTKQHSCPETMLRRHDMGTLTAESGLVSNDRNVRNTGTSTNNREEFNRNGNTSETDGMDGIDGVESDGKDASGLDALDANYLKEMRQKHGANFPFLTCENYSSQTCANLKRLIEKDAERREDSFFARMMGLATLGKFVDSDGRRYSL